MLSSRRVRLLFDTNLSAETNRSTDALVVGNAPTMLTASSITAGAWHAEDGR